MTANDASAARSEHATSVDSRQVALRLVWATSGPQETPRYVDVTWFDGTTVRYIDSRRVHQ